MNASDLKPHALATIVPDMLRDEYIELVADLRKNGLRQPIVLFEGRVLDGRHRLRGCIEANVPIRTDEFKGTRDEAEAFVLSLNRHRRHLSHEQKRKMIAAELKRDPSRSDRAIAKTASVDSKTVKAARSRAEANAEIPHKTDRTEASGRKARGRKAGVPATPKAQTQIAAGCPVAAVANVALSKRTAPGTADSDLGEVLSSIAKKESNETSEGSTAAEAKSVAHVAPAESMTPVLDAIRDTFALAELATIAAACLTRLLAEKLPSHILRRSELRAAAAELELATPKLLRRSS